MTKVQRLNRQLADIDAAIRASSGLRRASLQTRRTRIQADLDKEKAKKSTPLPPAPDWG